MAPSRYVVAALVVLVGACSATPSGEPRPTPSGDAAPEGSAPSPSVEAGLAAAEAAAPDAPAAPDAGPRWAPTPRDRFLYQLGDPRPDVAACAVPAAGGPCVRPTVWVFDLYASDGRTPNRAGVEAVHAAGGHAVCYVSGGSLEKGRPDAAAFPGSVVGKVLDGWPDERWLDVAQLGVLVPLMRARAEKCQAAGFDALEWDNVDGYANDNGLGITPAAQLTYNRALARVAHELGLSVALKNDLEQIPSLVADFDFAVNEQCAQYNECASLDPFTRAGKAVVQLEYEGSPATFCAAANAAGRAAAKMGLDLAPKPWTPCR
jgi:hypothetical protein